MKKDGMGLASEISRLRPLEKAGFFLFVLYALAVFAYSVQGALTQSWDQKSFYDTSVLLVRGGNPYPAVTDYIKNNTPDINFSGLDAAGGRTMYPPSAHLLFVPFYAFLVSSVAGQISWCVWNIVFMLIIFHVLRTRYLAEQGALVSCMLLGVIIASAASKSCIRYGQTSLFSFAFFALTVFVRERHKWIAGIFFAFAVIKPSLMVLFAVYFLIRREYIILLTAAGIHLILTVGLGIWIGVSPVDLVGGYLEKVHWQTAYRDGLWMYHQVNGIAVRSMLNLLNVPGQVTRFFSAILYLSAVVAMYRLRSIKEIRLLGFIGFATLFVDYHWHYDFVVLFLLFPPLLRYVTTHRNNLWLFCYYLVLICMPNLLRVGSILHTNTAYLLVWQFFYTTVYAVFFILYVRKIVLEPSAEHARGQVQNNRCP